MFAKEEKKRIVQHDDVIKGGEAVKKKFKEYFFVHL
jgi:hypothetical protein